MTVRRYGVEATLVLGRPTGIGRAVAEVCRRIPPLLRDGEELVLTARTFRMNPATGVSHAPLLALAAAPRTRLVRHVVPASVAERTGRLFPSWPVDRAAGALDVFHGTNHWLPATRARGVVTIHDLAALRFPEQVPAAFARRFRRVVTDAVRRAAAIVVPSETTRRDVIGTLGADPARVETIPHAAADAFHAPSDAGRDAAVVRAALGLAGPYVLCVGTTIPRKNVPRLVEAFARARRRAGLPHRLVLAGEPGSDDGAVRARIAALGLGDAVLVAGWVADDALPALVRRADVVAFPSLFEGFGLPVVEAFAAGTPVVASDAPGVAETAGGAAQLADPVSVDALADAIERVATDPALRARLVAAGRARAAAFRWEDAAARHLALYRRLAGEPR